jgi:hypothetical protein
LVIDVDEATALHLGVALRVYGLPEMQRVWRRNGLELPPALLDLAHHQLAVDRVVDTDPADRARRLAAERCRRYRARKRGEVVPLRRPGPAPGLAG